jgi:hypothetical protein
MSLPLGGFHEFFDGDAVRAVRQLKSFVGLAALTSDLRFLHAFGRFLRWGGLLVRLGSTLCNVAPRDAWLGFLVALGSPAAEAGAVPVSAVDVIMLSPLAVITVMTWITPVRPECK